MYVRIRKHVNEDYQLSILSLEILHPLLSQLKMQ